MGPKKGKFVRPTLPNPFMQTPQPQIGSEQIDQLFNLLVDKLSNLYPPQVSNSQVVAAFENELKSGKSDVNLSDLKKPDRKEKFRNKRHELRHAFDAKLEFELRKDVTIGLKKCLRDLSANRLCAVLFDSTVNLEPMRCIFEKGQPDGPTIIGVANLGECVRKPLGFPAVCIGFKNEVLAKAKEGKESVSHHFYPIIELINAVLAIDAKISKSVCDIVSKGDSAKKTSAKCDILNISTEKCKGPVISTASCIQNNVYSNEALSAMPQIELLYREDSNTRAFIPGEKRAMLVEDKNLFANSDFISCSSESPNNKRKKLY